MHTLDASSIVYAWDNYPIENFPKLWEWLASEANSKKLQICTENFTEVKDVAPDCADWLVEASINRIPVSNVIFFDASRIKNLLGISDDKFHPKGVDQNDLFAIACAKTTNSHLISNEAIQSEEPKEAKKRKIPAVCKMKEVNVGCLDFLAYLRLSKTTFG